MKIILVATLILLAVGLPLYSVYWWIFRPVLLVRLKYRLFQARDELRLMAIRGDVDARDRAYPILERCCNSGIARLDTLDLIDPFATKIDPRTRMEVERDYEIIKGANAKMRKIFDDIFSATLGAMCANSPGLLMVIAPFAVFSVLAWWFGRVKECFAVLEKRAWGFLYLQARSA